jgi:hypothetical protein
VNDELEKMYIEAIVVYQCGCSLEELKKTINVSAKTTGLWAEI